MALSNPTLLDTTTSTSPVTNLASGSFSPTGGGLLIVCSRPSDTDQNMTLVSSIVDTFTGTGGWTQYTDLLNTTDSGLDALRCSIFTAQLGGTPGSGTVTVSVAGGDDPGRWIMHCLEVTGFDTGTPITQSASNIDAVTAGEPATAGDITVTLGSSPDTDGLIIGSFSGQIADPVTPDASYTELVETTAGSGGGKFVGQVQYDNGGADTTANWDYAGTDDVVAVAIEIAIAAAAGGDSLAPFGNLRKRSFQHMIVR